MVWVGFVYTNLYNGSNIVENSSKNNNSGSINDSNVNISNNSSSTTSISEKNYQKSKIKTITSKADVIKEANNILNANREFYGKNAVVKKVEYGGNDLWFVEFVDSKTGKKVGWTIIYDETGKMADTV